MQCSPWRVLQTSAQRQSSAECVSLTGQMSDTRWKESFFVLAAHTEVGGMEGEGWGQGWGQGVWQGGGEVTSECTHDSVSDLITVDESEQ